ncbi:MAG: ATP-binding protein [bacterium]|nr:ATP-binding protein [bacterium]
MKRKATLEDQIAARTAELEAANEQLQHEIAERKRMEQYLIRLERLRALGKMSEGVAHNFNNILVGVLGFAQIIQAVASDPEIVDYADRIVDSALRAKHLVTRLNQSLHTGEEEIGAVDVNSVVQEAVETTRPRWKDESEVKGISIEVVTELEQVPAIGGTQDGLGDVVINLLFNAIDAVPEGGRITVRTQAVADGVRLTVQDTGIGMDQETKRRVFEPFFSTKGDVGSGLGLSVVHGTITRWGGIIEVETTAGEGTAFVARLPAWTGPETVEKEAVVDIPPKRPARVLVVDDDGNVRDLVQSVLEQDHEVDTAPDGPKALDRFAPGRYDVVVLDLGMPGMSGDLVAAEMRRADPEVALVLITGWNLEEDDPRLSIFDFQLSKPVMPLDDVRHTVNRGVALHDRRAEGKA